MKAYVLQHVNDLKYKDVPLPSLPSCEWCLVKVRAAGICSSDIPRIFTKGTYHFPTIPGHEFSGEVYSVGDKNYSDLIGKHVGVFPLIPCRSCEQCKTHHYEMCSHYDYLGSRRDGGFAEYVAVPIWNLVPLPDDMPFVFGAMLEPLSVALTALRNIQLSGESDVAVIGTGMIGICAAQFAKMKGAHNVIVFGRSELKREIVESCNINYETGIPTERQFDVVLEAVGASEAICSAIRLTKPGGSVVLIGNPYGDITLSQDLYWQILRKQLIIHGTWNSQFEGNAPSIWSEVVDAVDKGRVSLKPLITHTYDQNDLMEGLNLMKSHSEPYCKVMTLWG